MHAAAIHLSAGSDLRRSLEELSRQHNASGFVLSVVGNLSVACFACPGRTTPTRWARSTSSCPGAPCWGAIPPCPAP